MLARYLPILEWARTDNRSVLTNDLMAAVIVTIMLIPQTLAYALTCDWQVGFANSKSTNLVLAAWFHMGNLSKGKSVEYKIKDSRNGVYAFIIDGDVSIEGQELNRRDGYGVWDTDKINIDAISNARVLLMEVPMTM